MFISISDCFPLEERMGRDLETIMFKPAFGISLIAMCFYNLGS